MKSLKVSTSMPVLSLANELSRAIWLSAHLCLIVTSNRYSIVALVAIDSVRVILILTWSK
jgi:hypothetical protein